MISVSTAFTNTIKTAISAATSQRVIAEWNHNIHSSVATTDNWGSSTEDVNAYDPGIFPISSIVQPFRPTSGIMIAKTTEGGVTLGNVDVPPAIKSYTASVDNKYKYWTSQAPSTSSGYLGSTANGYVMDPTMASPYVLYTNQVWADKIYICFEKSWSAPVYYDISVTTNGTTWTTVASNIAPDSKGVVAIYHQGAGAWSTTVNRSNPTQLKGVRVVVNSMSLPSSYLNLIELGLRLEQDLSTYVTDYSVSMSMGEPDLVAPIGLASSNTGSINLSNLDGRFNNAAPSGADSTPTYRGLIDKNVLFTIDLGVDTTAGGGSGIEYVRQATMYSDQWSTTEEQSSITLKDGSMYLQQVDCPQLLIQGVTIGQALWHLLDSIGYNSYSYIRPADTSATTIDYFWTDPSKTVWETLQEVCRYTQSALYYDVLGILQIKTREALFDQSKIGSPVWTFDDKLNGTKQPDIYDQGFTENQAYEVNKVTINYKPTTLAHDELGRPINEVLWTPTDTIALRSAALAEDMTSSQMFFKIGRQGTEIWPYSGLVNIRGELISYDGKTYRYVDKNGNWATVIVNNSDEKLHVDNDLTMAGQAWKNYFTGKFIITERGVDWTTAAAHDTTIASWKAAGPAHGSTGGSQTTWTGGLQHIQKQSIMRLHGKASFDLKHFYTAPHGAVLSQPATNFGTRIKFPTEGAGQDQIGGLFFYSNSAMNSMYTVEIVSTDWLSKNNKKGHIKEVRIMKRDSGNYTSLVGNGVTHGIGKDVWYDIDVTILGNTFTVYVNGTLATSVTDSSLSSTNKLGLYTRGHTVMDAEFFYYANNAGWPADDPDNTSFLDLINGGYYSNQFYRNGYYKTREVSRKHGKRSQTYKQRYAQRFFDEFGILVHEVRDFSVKFDKYPVLFSEIYTSNTDQAVTLNYLAGPFSADFTLANAARRNVIINGDDSLTFSGNSVAQKLFIFGQTVQQGDQQTIVKLNQSAINARGEIPLEISSDWIQSQSAAEQLAQWAVDRWSIPADQLDIQVFANPMIEVGDVVGLNYSPRNIAGNKYFILKIAHSWENGPGTTVSLRRAQ